MRRIQYSHYGGPEVLEPVEVPEPQPAAGQVRVRVRAAGLNPVDIKTAQGIAPLRVAETALHAVQRLRSRGQGEPRFPRGIGRDFAGRVEAISPDVERFTVGDRVLGTLRSAPTEGATRGALAEYIVVDAASLVPTPVPLDDVPAASLGVAAETACGALRHLKVGPGDVLVVSVAAGGVGSRVVQLARLRGAEVIGIAGASSVEYLKALGATPVVYGPGIEDRLRAALQGRGPTAFLDCFGKGYVAPARHLGVPPRRIGTLVPSPPVILGRAQFTGSRHAQAGDLAAVARLVGDGEVSVRVQYTIPLAQESVRNAYRELLSGHAAGKIVVTMGE